MDDLNNSGIENPILGKNFEENSFENMIMPPFISSPIIPQRNNNKKYSNETIDKMISTLNDFYNNINKVMETTNRMNNIIDKYNANFINISISYKINYNFFIKCKLIDKISDAFNKIKIPEDGFDINNKLIFFNGRNIDINKTFKDENIFNGALLFIADKE